MSHNRNFNIEVLEPLLLMSASACEADAADVSYDFDCDSEANSHCAFTGDDGDDDDRRDRNDNDRDDNDRDGNDRDGDCDWRSSDSKDNPWNVWGKSKRNDGNRDGVVCRSGNRADYSVEDHGFGIFALRCGNNVDFVTDVTEIQFDDGDFAICDLIPGEPNVDVVDPGDQQTDDFNDFDDDRDDDQSEVSNKSGSNKSGSNKSGSNKSGSNNSGSNKSGSNCSQSGGDTLIPNGPPVANDDANTTDYETSVDGNVLQNDRDTDGDSLTVTLSTPPSNGTVTLTVGGDYIYTPNDEFSGQDTFTYEVSDGNGGTDTATVTIEVCPAPNQGPDANDDANTTDVNTPVDGNVSGNDSDPDGDTLDFSLVSGTANGSVTLNADGSYTYVPDADFVGQDTFDYEVSDGNGGTDTATVTIDIQPELIIDPPPPTPVEPCPVDPGPDNQDPDAVNDSNSTAYNTAVDGTVLGNDVDPDGDILTVTLHTPPANGIVTITEDGSYTYTPHDGFSGQDIFSYEVSDGNGGTDTAEVTIDVAECPVAPEPSNDAPDAQDDTNSTTEDVAVSGSVAGNDSDPDGDDLTFYVYEGPENGSIEFSEDGSYTYTPDPGFSGQDSFIYEAADGNGGSDFATVNIDVIPTPNADPDAQDDTSSTTEDLAVSGSVDGNDSDPDGDTLTFYVEDGPSWGSLEFSEDGSYTYTPDPGFSGSDTFTYQVSDGNGGTDTATVTITVEPTRVCGTVVTPPGTAALGSRVWADADGDGIQDAGEAGIPGVTVELINADGDVIETTTTDDNGAYRFDGLDAGDYSVSFQATDGHEFTTADNGDDAADSDADSNGRTQTITLVDGEQNWTVDAGMVCVPVPTDIQIPDLVCEDPDHPNVIDLIDTVAAGNGHTTSFTVNMNSEGSWQNGFYIFDYNGPNDFKFAGARAGVDYWTIGEFNNGEWNDLATLPEQIDADVDLQISVNVDGDTVSLTVDGTEKLSHAFSIIGSGQIGFGNECANTSISDVVVAGCKVAGIPEYQGLGGEHWGDPHFRGDDGGLYDIQGKDGAVYNMLSDGELQYNLQFKTYPPFPEGTVAGEAAIMVGDNTVHIEPWEAPVLNGEAIEEGTTVYSEDGKVSITWNWRSVKVSTPEYDIEILSTWAKGIPFLNGVYKANGNPFADGIDAHGLWGQTVDADTDAVSGDLGTGVQGGGAIQTIDADGNVVLSQSGDMTAVNLYEMTDLFSRTSVMAEGEAFLRSSIALTEDVWF